MFIFINNQLKTLTSHNQLSEKQLFSGDVLHLFKRREDVKDLLSWFYSDISGTCVIIDLKVIKASMII